MKTLDHFEMEENVVLQIANFLGLPKSIVWFELRFAFDEDPLVTFVQADSDNIKQKVVLLDCGDHNKSGQIVVDEVALFIANLFAEIPDHFREYTIRFEVMEIPLVTFTSELHSAYKNTQRIKEALVLLKHNYSCALRESS
jgi:hypothetical protein